MGRRKKNKIQTHNSILNVFEIYQSIHRGVQPVVVSRVVSLNDYDENDDEWIRMENYLEDNGRELLGNYPIDQWVRAGFGFAGSNRNGQTPYYVQIVDYEVLANTIMAKQTNSQNNGWCEGALYLTYQILLQQYTHMVFELGQMTGFVKMYDASKRSTLPKGVKFNGQTEGVNILYKALKHQNNAKWIAYRSEAGSPINREDAKHLTSFAEGVGTGRGVTKTNSC